jgi:thioredoxin
MKYILACLLATLAFATSNEDLKFILEKSYLEKQCAPLLNMIAAEAAAEGEKKIDPEVLVEQFRKNFSDEEVLAKFSEPYRAVFSDEELKELKKIYETPVWAKYSVEGMKIVHANLQTMKECFIELVSQYKVEEGAAAEEIASADVLQITKENQDEIANAQLPMIIDINASWCSACKMMDPIIEEMSEKYNGVIQFAKVDYDSQAELVKRFGVSALPTIVFLKPGKKDPVMKNVGYIDKQDFETKIAEFLKK